MQKWQTISELAAITGTRITNSPENWRQFLTTAARFYKAYDFSDQLLIYAQRPNATACADMATWNGTMRRWVNYGSTAIALVRKGYGGKPYLDYVHDVADTHPLRGGKTPWLWRIRPENREAVCDMLRENFEASGTGLGDLLMHTGERLANEISGDYLRDLMYEKTDSFLEELDELNTEVAFRTTLRASVQFSLLSRCGLDPMDYLEDDDLRGITDFNTPAVLACLGAAAAQANRTVLLEIASTVRRREQEILKKPLAKEKETGYNNFITVKRERSDENGKPDIQPEQRVSGAEPADGRGRDADRTAGTLRTDAGEVPDGAQAGPISIYAADRQAVDTPDGDRPAGGGHDGTLDTGDGGEHGRKRSDEGRRPAGMGTEDEHDPALGRGKRIERPDLQLTAAPAPELDSPFSSAPAFGQISLFASPEQQVNTMMENAEAPAPAFFSANAVPEHVVDMALSAGGVWPDSDLRIYARYQAGEAPHELAAFLRSEYKEYGRGFTLDGQPYSIWTDGGGMKIAAGKAARFERSAMTLTWEQVEQRTRALVERGAYLPAERVPLARERAFRDLAEHLWYMMQDTRDRADTTARMPVLSSLYWQSGGFPASTRRILETLKSEEGYAALQQEVRSFASAYERDNSLMRYRLYEPPRLRAEMEMLARPVREFSVRAEHRQPRASFITQDEIDDMLAGHSAQHDYRLDMDSFFSAHPDRQERQARLREHFGISGRGSLILDTWFDGKGMKLERADRDGKYDTVLLRWPQAEKRISDLMAANRWLTEQDRAAIPTYTVTRLAQRIDTFFAFLPEHAPYERQLMEPEENQKKIIAMLDIPEQVDTLLTAMRSGLQGMTPEERGYESCTQAYDSLNRFKNGTFDLWRQGGADAASRKTQKRAAKPKQSVDTLEAARRSLFQNSAQAGNTGEQLSFDTVAQPDSADGTPEPAKLRTVVIDLTAPARDVSVPVEKTITDADVDKLLLEDWGVEGRKGRIYDRFQQGRSIAGMAWYLGQEYNRHDASPDALRTGGFLPLTDGNRGYAYYVGEGVRMEPRPGKIRVVSYTEMAQRIQQLIAEKRYMTPEELTAYQEAQAEAPAAPIVLREFDLGFGHLGNGITVWNRLEEENGDYKTLAHIAQDRSVFFYDDDLPHEIRQQIQETAKRTDMTVSATQEKKVFFTPPTEQEQAKEALTGPRGLDADGPEAGQETTPPQLEQPLPQTGAGVPETDSAEDEVLTVNGPAYLRLKAEHPGAVVGVESGRYFLFCGEDATTIAAELNRKTVTRDIPGLGETVLTGFTHGWPAAGKALQLHGFNVVFARENGDSYDVIVDRSIADFIPVGMKLAENDRVFTVDSVDYRAGSVSLRDDTFAGRTGFPIFRSEPVAAVREWVEQQEDADLKAAAENKPALNPIPVTTLPSEDALLAEAQGLIADFCWDEYRAETDFTQIDPRHVGLAYTTTEDEAHEVQVEADLTGCNMNYLVDGVVARQEHYESLRELIDRELRELNFGDLTDTAMAAAAQLRERQAVPENYRITDPDIGAGGQKMKYQNNVAAIRLLKTLEAEERQASPAEQDVLARYSGWGGVPQAFDAHNEKWAKEYEELKELLAPDEYAAARGSTLNAHYTSPLVIQSIYDTLSRMGVQPGTVLEPAMGVGNFFGLLPQRMGDAQLYGVELDSITGRIAKQLYPKANITVSGFEHVNLPDNSIDLAVGNVPFGNYRLSDPRYKQYGFLIHDYFFAKTLDKVRTGGIVAFITSKGTMDKQDTAVREYLAQRADLLGAVRLPSSAFSKTANTEVTTDILFLQKRDTPPEQLPDWVQLGKTADGIPVNRYYEQHPEMVLGTMIWDKSMYGNEKETSCQPLPDADLKELLAAASAQIAMPDAERLARPSRASLEELQASVNMPQDVRSFSYTVQGGKLYYKESTSLTAVDVPPTTAERIRGMISVRDITRRLIDLQLNNGSDDEIHAAQAELNTVYDRFTEKYGLLNAAANKRAFEKDSSYCLLCSLELLDDDGKLERKADMFTKRTINREVVIDHVDTASEALAVSIGERARVDLPFMAHLLGREDTQSIIDDLKGVIFRNPEAGGGPLDGWETADEYLSGNVRRKLAAARTAAEQNDAFAENVTALEQAKPADLTAAEIDVRIGATWIDPRYYTQFIHELLKTPLHARRNVKALYSEATGEWRVAGKTLDSTENTLAYMTYGTKRRSAYTIIEDSLNLRDSRVYDTVTRPDGGETRELNAKETILAQQRQDMIREAFKSWIWKDPERREALCQKYNELFNAIRPREYNGDHLRFPGMTPEVSLLPHQRNAVARMLYGGNALLAHCVGAGKTFECIAAAMESKRLGLVKKSLMVVPNHLTEQWGADFLRLYPGANILVATKRDFEPANRKTFCSRIATGDYDAVIIGHSQFEKIPLSPERQRAVIENQIDQIVDSIDEAKREDGERYTIKQLEKMRKSLEGRLESLNDRSRKDNVVNFEELGVDKLFVDEAHAYKNLFLATKMRNVAGIGQTDAQKSSDMFAKCRYLDEITGGRGVVFATGTPVSNSMTELYTMMRYLQYQTLEEAGLVHFDSWAASFGETVTAMELAPEGTGFRSRTRFARFFNLPELMAMWREAADIQTADMLKLPVPEHESITVVTKPSAYQQDMVADLGERAELIRRRMVEPREDNMLKVTSDGRKLALDQRLSDPDLPDDPESKVNVCVQNVYQVWQDTTEQKGAQMIFCDLSTPGNARPVEMTQKEDGTYEMAPFQNVYEDIRAKLVTMGVPEKEIAFIHEAKTENQKAELFANVRKGQVRVLLGSTAKMGAGTNCQKRLAALHHVDCPWRPADIEQREGRILRRGNDFKKVKIFKYVTEGTFDAYNWSVLENKQKFIGQLTSGKNPSRTCEDIDAAALSYAEVKALASGDPRIIEYTELDAQVTKLKLVKANHESQRYALEDKLLKYFPQAILREKELIAALEKDAAHLQAHTPLNKDTFSVTILGQTYTERKAAGQAILDACTGMKDVSERIELGEYRGFPLTLWANTQNQKFQLTLRQALSHDVELGGDAVGNFSRMDHVLDEVGGNLEKHRAILENLTSQQQEAKEEVHRPFAQEQELTAKTQRLNVLRLALNMDKGGTGRERPQTEQAEEKPSIRGMLKRLEAEAAAVNNAPQGRYDREVAI